MQNALTIVTREFVMRKFLAAGAMALFSMFSIDVAAASVIARIDVSSQTMNVYVNGSLEASWPVSTARRGYHTPRGSYTVKTMKRMHYSSKYNNSPMPHSLFFKGGYAVHGTGAVGQLGRPASHGCVRLSPGHAAQLYSLMRANGGGRIVVQN